MHTRARRGHNRPPKHCLAVAAQNTQHGGSVDLSPVVISAAVIDERRAISTRVCEPSAKRRQEAFGARNSDARLGRLASGLQPRKRLPQLCNDNDAITSDSRQQRLEGAPNALKARVRAQPRPGPRLACILAHDAPKLAADEHDPMAGWAQLIMRLAHSKQPLKA